VLHVVSCLFNDAVSIKTIHVYSVSDRMINECGAVDGMRTDRGDRNTLRRPISMSLCPSEIPYDLIEAGPSRCEAVGYPPELWHDP
jgi:hypothetical protein